MPRVLDFRSDTVTRPSEGMRQAIAEAQVGDNVFGEDPEVSALEAHVAQMCGREAALFVASGTMANQIAVKAHTSPGDEVITEERYHLAFFESAQACAFAGICLHACRTENGILGPKDLEECWNRKARGSYNAQAKLLILENSVNGVAGISFPASALEEVARPAKARGVSVHLDGARVLNACVKWGLDVREYSQVVDSLSICLSKGLGCPMGSVLVGDSAFIAKAHTLRKWYGGGLHQAGFMAAAGRYALGTNWRGTLLRDHENAGRLTQALADALPQLSIRNGGTNIIMVNTRPTGRNAQGLVARMREIGLQVLPWSHDTIRLVTHQDQLDGDVECAAKAFHDAIAPFLNKPSTQRQIGPSEWEGR